MITRSDQIRFSVLTATEIVAWGEVPHEWPELSDDIHLWRLTLDGASAAEIAALGKTLCDDERERAGQYHFEAHRRRFVIGRSLVREILSRYVKLAPAALRYSYSQWGKPHVADAAHVHFNYSNTEDLGLLAIRRAGPVGVDVERADRRAWTVREAILKATGFGVSGLNCDIDACTVQTFIPAAGFIASVALLDPARRSEFPAS